jgi:hypothetical protein
MVEPTVIRGLEASDRFALIATISPPPPGSNGPNQLVLVVDLPQTFVTGASTYSVTLSDTYGLAENWYYGEGTILGYANESQAKFANTCVSTDLSLHGTAEAPSQAPINITTGESNNLTAVGLPASNCATGVCSSTIQATSGEPSTSTCYRPPPASPAASATTDQGGGQQFQICGVDNQFCRLKIRSHVPPDVVHH